MPTSGIQYGTPSALTHSLQSLASSAATSGVGRESTAVDNTSTLATDYSVGGKIKTGTTTANTQIEVWASGTYDTTSFVGGATGVDAALTLIPAMKALLKLIALIQIPDTTVRTYPWGCASISNLFGFTPAKWNVWVLNTSNAALDATGGNHETKSTPFNYTSA